MTRSDYWRREANEDAGRQATYDDISARMDRIEQRVIAELTKTNDCTVTEAEQFARDRNIVRRVWKAVHENDEGIGYRAAIRTAIEEAL
jgi:hypothetical protein